MSAALPSSVRAAFPVALALLVSACAVAAPGAENDEWIEQAMGDDLDAGALDAAPVDVEPMEPIDPGIIVPPFGSLAGGTVGEPGGGTTGGAGTMGGVTPGAPRDAGAGTGRPRDASTGTPRDASTTRPPTTTTRDAGRPSSGSSGSGGASCNVLTCPGCSVAGPFPCCNLLGTCGCTWAPGAYCL